MGLTRARNTVLETAWQGFTWALEEGQGCPSSFSRPVEQAGHVQVQGSKERVVVAEFFRKLRGSWAEIHRNSKAVSTLENGVQENPDFLSLPWIPAQSQCGKELLQRAAGFLFAALKNKHRTPDLAMDVFLHTEHCTKA